MNASPPPVDWVLASGNEGKRAEFERLLGATGWRLQTQSALGISPADETAVTFVENALAKARHAAAASGLPALADDSGLVVPALGGAPGVRSARYAGTGADDEANVARLLAELERRPGDARTAYFVCVLVALRAADDPDPLVARGTWHGRIATAPRGRGGFGYDPVFVPADDARTAAELAPHEKAAASHRGEAVRALLAALAVPAR